MKRIKFFESFNMSREDMIIELKSLIREYEDLNEELSSMYEMWDKHDDPASDPGLQYEKETEVDKSYNAIREFAKKM